MQEKCRKKMQEKKYRNKKNQQCKQASIALTAPAPSSLYALSSTAPVKGRGSGITFWSPPSRPPSRPPCSPPWTRPAPVKGRGSGITFWSPPSRPPCSPPWTRPARTYSSHHAFHVSAYFACVRAKIQARGGGARGGGIHAASASSPTIQTEQKKL
jgi:hypothetical protein